MTDYQTIIREAALKNRASIKEDDVLMVVVTVMNRIVEDQIQALTAAHEQHRTISQEVALAWRKDAAERANQILNVALDASRAAMAKGMNEGGAKIVAIIRDAVETSLGEMREQAASMERAVTAHRRFTVWMLAANFAVLIAALAISERQDSQTMTASSCGVREGIRRSYTPLVCCSVPHGQVVFQSHRGSSRVHSKAWTPSTGMRGR